MLCIISLYHLSCTAFFDSQIVAGSTTSGNRSHVSMYMAQIPLVFDSLPRFSLQKMQVNRYPSNKRAKGTDVLHHSFLALILNFRTLLFFGPGVHKLLVLQECNNEISRVCRQLLNDLLGCAVHSQISVHVSFKIFLFAP